MPAGLLQVLLQPWRCHSPAVLAGSQGKGLWAENKVRQQCRLTTRPTQGHGNYKLCFAVLQSAGSLPGCATTISGSSQL